MLNEHDEPSNKSPKGNDSGWLREPAWENTSVGDIGEAEVMTPDLLETLEGALSASPKRGTRPTTQAECGVLEVCGTFNGSGPGSCQKLKSCDKYT